MKLRFGWGPIDGAAGMQGNSTSCARCARRSATTSTSWPTPTWAGRSTMRKRMLPLLEPFDLRWLEEPVIPDDIHGYAELRAWARADRRRRA